MNSDLHFFADIMSALDSPEPDNSLERAFARIEKMAREPENRQGWGQYLAFMSAVLEASVVTVQAFKDGRSCGLLKLTPGGRSASLSDLTPGRFALRLETGRLLWEDDISEADLILGLAFPDEPFAVAAATGTGLHSPSRQEVIAGGEILLSVLPGIETGNLQLKFQTGGTS